MAASNVSAFQALEQGVDAFVRHFLKVILGNILYGAALLFVWAVLAVMAGLVLGLVGYSPDASPSPLALVMMAPFALAAAAAFFYLMAGQLRFLFDVLDRRPVALSTMFKPGRAVLGFSLASLAVGVLTGLGFAAFVLPGIFVGLTLAFAPMLALDQGLSAGQALKRSWELTRGHFLSIVGLWILTACMNTMGVIFLGLGTLATVPITFLAFLALYRQVVPGDSVPTEDGDLEDEAA